VSSQALAKFRSVSGLAPETPLRSISPETLVRFRDALVATRLARWTVLTHLYAVRQMFRLLAARGLIFEDPSAALAMPKKPAGPVGRVLSEDEVRTWLSSVPCATPVEIRDAAILECLYATGARRSELAGLAVADVDLEGASLRLRATKGGAERMVPLTQPAVERLSTYLALRRGASEALWLAKGGGPLGPHAIAQMVKVRAARAGIRGPVSTHTIRRSVATHLLRAGATPSVVAELLGHRRFETLSRYVGLQFEDLRRAHGRFHPRA
jgi:integrase/recombinase XerD